MEFSILDKLLDRKLLFKKNRTNADLSDLYRKSHKKIVDVYYRIPPFNDDAMSGLNIKVSSARSVDYKLGLFYTQRFVDFVIAYIEHADEISAKAQEFINEHKPTKKETNRLMSSFLQEMRKISSVDFFIFVGLVFPLYDEDKVIVDKKDVIGYKELLTNNYRNTSRPSTIYKLAYLATYFMYEYMDGIIKYLFPEQTKNKTTKELSEKNDKRLGFQSLSGTIISHFEEYYLTLWMNQREDQSKTKKFYTIKDIDDDSKLKSLHVKNKKSDTYYLPADDYLIGLDDYHNDIVWDWYKDILWEGDSLRYQRGNEGRIWNVKEHHIRATVEKDYFNHGLEYYLTAYKSLELNGWIAPESPIKYAGAKKNQYGFMLQYIVSRLPGDSSKDKKKERDEEIQKKRDEMPYEYFIDVFGGSGTASVQLEYNQKIFKKYITNEVGYDNYLFFHVLKNDYQKFLDRLNIVLSFIDEGTSSFNPTNGYSAISIQPYYLPGLDVDNSDDIDKALYFMFESFYCSCNRNTVDEQREIPRMIKECYSDFDSKEKFREYKKRITKNIFCNKDYYFFVNRKSKYNKKTNVLYFDPPYLDSRAYNSYDKNGKAVKYYRRLEEYTDHEAFIDELLAGDFLYIYSHRSHKARNMRLELKQGSVGKEILQFLKKTKDEIDGEIDSCILKMKKKKDSETGRTAKDVLDDYINLYNHYKEGVDNKNDKNKKDNKEKNEKGEVIYVCLPVISQINSVLLNSKDEPDYTRIQNYIIYNILNGYILELMFTNINLKEDLTNNYKKIYRVTDSSDSQEYKIYVITLEVLVDALNRFKKD
jgi:hypothetical protein